LRDSHPLDELTASSLWLRWRRAGPRRSDDSPCLVLSLAHFLKER
jgi:hypothetical protein